MKNEIKDAQGGRHLLMGDYFKTLREPLLEQQKKTDQKKDKLIEQLKENQDRIVQAIEFNPNQAITFEGEKLPEREYEDEDGDEDEEEGEEEGTVAPKPSASKIFNFDKGINDEYKELLKSKDFELPSKLLESPSAVDDSIKKVKGRMNRSETYIKEPTTKKGQPLQKLPKIQRSTLARNQKELLYMEIEAYKSSPEIHG